MKLAIVKNSCLSAAGRGVHLIVPFVIAAFFGSTPETDVFFLTYGLILFLTLVIGYIFENVIVPIVAEVLHARGDVGKLVGGILFRGTLFLLFFLPALLLIFKPLIRLTTNLPEPSLELGFRLSLLMAPTILLVTWTSALSGALNAAKFFSVPALSPAVRSAVVIGAIVLWGKRLGVEGIAVGYTVGELLRFGVAFGEFQKRLGPLHFGWETVPGITSFFESIAPQALGFSFFYLVPVVNQMTTSWIGAGEISLYTYAERIRNVPFLIFSTGVLPVILSYWANEQRSNPETFSWRKSRRLIWAVTGITALIFLAAWFCRDFIVTFALGRGAFPQAKLGVTGSLFSLLLACFPFEAMALLCIRLLIIFKKDWAYVVWAFAKLIGIGILNVFMVPAMGILGVGFSVAVVNSIFGLLLYAYVSHLYGRER